MKVYGQLEKAQLENLASDPATAAEGMVYYNTTTGTPRIYKAGSWSDMTGSGVVSVASVITASSTTPALRITQTGTGDALLVEDSANPDATPFVVDTNGNVGVGTATPSAKLTTNVQLATDESIRISSSQAVFNAQNTYMTFTTGGSKTARIGLYANGSGLGGSLCFFTNSTDNGAVAERLRIQNDGYVGIRTATAGFAATSTLHVAGSVAKQYETFAGNITLGDSHSTALMQSGSAITATLPDASTAQGRIYTIKRMNTGAVTVATTSSQTIDGATTYSLPAQYSFVTVQSIASGWVIIGKG